MTINCIWELQQAIYAALDGDAALGNMITGIFDHVPQDTGYPYVTIGEMRAKDYSTKTTQGAEIDVTVNVISRDKGSKTCLDILARIHDLLHDADLALATCTLVSIRFTSTEINRRADGLTYQGINRFRAIVQV